MTSFPAIASRTLVLTLDQVGASLTIALVILCIRVASGGIGRDVLISVSNSTPRVGQTIAIWQISAGRRSPVVSVSKTTQLLRATIVLNVIIRTPFKNIILQL